MLFFSLPLSFAATFVCCQMQAVGLQSLVAQDKVRSTDTLGNGGIAPDKCVYHPIAPKGQKHAVFNRKKKRIGLVVFVWKMMCRYILHNDCAEKK